MVLEHYNVRIKGKDKQSREWSSAHPVHVGVVAIEKWAFESPTTTVANFTFLYYIYIYIYIYIERERERERKRDYIYTTIVSTKISKDQNWK